MATGALSFDGARAYHLRPEGSSDLSLTMTLMQSAGTEDFGGGVETTDLGVVVLTPAYRHTFDVMGNAGTFLIGMPLGAMSYSSSAGTIDVATDIAQGDLFIGGVFGLVGAPSLSVMEYVQYKPGFQASAAARLFLPTGDYDATRMLNLGGNRWSLEASLPMSFALGESMIDPALMTFEVRPVVQIFGDNEDPFGGATVTSQAPIFGVEGHVTRNFGNSVWAALDGYYETGGERSADGVALGDGLDVFSLGATLGLVLSPSLAMRFSYREQAYSSAPDSSGRTLEVSSAFLF
jgi:hypothetical protein